MTEMNSAPIAPHTLARNPIHLISFGLGSGLSPWAPGTMGTAAALPLVWYLAQLGLEWYIVLTVVICIIGVWTAGLTARALGAHDHGAIVIDEVAGILITMVGVEPSALTLAAGFGLFRLFDIAKPWPIRVVDRKAGGGIGIMADDVLAGVAAALCLHGLIWCFPSLL
jgi:phosphatidylglycerophosphatase A